MGLLPAWSLFPPLFTFQQMYYKQTKEGFASKQLFVLFPEFNSFFSRFSSSDYWFNQMYYGTHGPFKRAEGGQAITFENDKVLFSSHSIIYDIRKWHFCCPGQSLPTYDNIIWKWILGSDTSHQYHCSLVKTIKGFIFSRPEVQLQGLWSLE